MKEIMQVTLVILILRQKINQMPRFKNKFYFNNQIGAKKVNRFTCSQF